MNSKKGNQPVGPGAGVAKVPLIMQMEALECGAACLAMVLAYYQKWVPLEEVRIACGVSRDGSSMKKMYTAAENYGLEVHAYRMEPEGLKRIVTFPCIIHWNFNHFVVLDGFKRDYAILNDPANGIRKVPVDEFYQSFTGLCMTFAPTKDFVPSGRRKSMAEFARKRLRGAGLSVAFVAVISLITYMFDIINPVMSRVYFDRILNKRAPEWFLPFIFIMAIMAVIQIGVEWVRVVNSLKIDGKMAVENNAGYMWKVLHLPMEFFSQRWVGDILHRQDANAQISGTLVKTVAPLVLNALMLVFYLAVMLNYSVPMTMVGMTALLLNILAARYTTEKRINLSRVQLRDESRLAGATLAGISMTETIKSSGAEEGFFKKWSGYQASVNKQRVRFAALNARMAMITQFIAQAGNYAVLFLGVGLTIEGRFSLGMIMAFQGILTAFMEPANMMISAGQTIQEMRTQMERVEDVMEYPNDPVLEGEFEPVDDNWEKLKGEIEVRNLTFGYSRLDAPVITDISFHIKPGERVAIVGASGSGKSTISKLITGLYQPWEGEIEFDGRPIGDIPRIIFTSSVSMVDQDIVLFEDTIYNNIRIWDSSINEYEVILAARDAQIHEDIVNRPGGYQSKLIENGNDLSGGQRQRLEVARALAQDPTIIILDEASSALDALTEYEMVKAIENRGLTCIVIAHRLSTIRDCDQIIVLDKGKIVERGTHEELYAKGGIYTDLITSE